MVSTRRGAGRKGTSQTFQRELEVTTKGRSRRHSVGPPCSTVDEEEEHVNDSNGDAESQSKKHVKILEDGVTDIWKAVSPRGDTGKMPALQEIERKKYGRSAKTTNNSAPRIGITPARKRTQRYIESLLTTSPGLTSSSSNDPGSGKKRDSSLSVAIIQQAITDEDGDIYSEEFDFQDSPGTGGVRPVDGKDVDPLTTGTPGAVVSYSRVLVEGDMDGASPLPGRRQPLFPQTPGGATSGPSKLDLLNDEDSDGMLEKTDLLLIDGQPAKNDMVNGDVATDGPPQEQQKQQQQHELYGRLLADLGNRKVYLMSARTLTTRVPVWVGQRRRSNERIKEIVEAKARDLSFMGTISIFDFNGLGPSYEIPQSRAVFDGQHRVGAMIGLLKGHGGVERAPNFDFNVIVEVYMVGSMTEVHALFVEVNKAEMVQDLDLEPRPLPYYYDSSTTKGATSSLPIVGGGGRGGEGEGGWDGGDGGTTSSASSSAALLVPSGAAGGGGDNVSARRRVMVDEVVRELVAKAPLMFSASVRCQAPNVNQDVLRNKLYQACTDSPKLKRVRQASILMKMIMNENHRLSRLPRETWISKRAGALKKATQHDFFLGMYSTDSWIENLRE